MQTNSRAVVPRMSGRRRRAGGRAESSPLAGRAVSSQEYPHRRRWDHPSESVSLRGVAARASILTAGILIDALLKVSAFSFSSEWRNLSPKSDLVLIEIGLGIT